MRNEDFEVGKKYTYSRSNQTTPVVTVIGFDSTGHVVVESYTGGIFRLSLDLDWRPYKEPAKGSIWVNVYPSNYSSSSSSRFDADDRAGTDRIACIKVDWVEGQGLDQGTDK